MRLVNPKNLEAACEAAAAEVEKPEMVKVLNKIKTLDKQRKQKIKEINDQFEKECKEIWREISSKTQGR